MRNLLSHTDVSTQNTEDSPIRLDPPKGIKYAAWILIGFVFIIVVLVCSKVYTKSVTVQGRTISSKGVIKIYPNGAGVVLKILKREGQQVSVGEDIFIIEPTQLYPVALKAGTLPLPEALIENLESRKSINVNRIEASRNAIKLLSENLIRQQQELAAQMELINKEIDEQKNFVARAQSEINRRNSLVMENFLSPASIKAFEDELATQRKAQLILARQKNEIEFQKTAITKQLQELQQKEELQANQYVQQNLMLDAETADLKSKNRISLKSPVSGIVQNITCNAGDALRQSPLAMVLPDGAKIAGEILVSSRSIGFIKTGQSVRIRYHAFPYQKYGVFIGKVSDVATAPMELSEDISAQSRLELFFKVMIEIEDQTLSIQERTIPLKPGMTFDIDIRTDTRLIVEWIFEPVFALKKYF